jgi:hypothetical protein
MGKVKVSKDIEVDDSVLLAHLYDYAQVMGKDLGEVVRQQAGLFCQDMVAYSRPFDGNKPGTGAGLAAKRHGEDSLRRSVFHIFRAIDQATSSQIADVGSYDVFKMWTKRKGESVQGKKKQARWVNFQKTYAKGNTYAFVPAGGLSEIGAIHKSHRIDDGHGGLTSAARNRKEPFAIVAKESDLEKYIRKEKESVGRLKSAYFFAARAIKRDIKAPAWAQNNGGAPFAFGKDDISKPMQPEATVGNLIGARGGNRAFVQLALKHRTFAMRNAMAQELKKKKLSLWDATMQGKVSGTRTYFK